MELEADDMRVLGAIKRGADSVRFLKNIVNLKKNDLEQILDVLDESHLIKPSYASGFLGQKKLVIQITDSGIKKIDEFVAEGNLLSLIKILLVREAIDIASGGTTYNFFISPRGVCVLEELGIDRGITFNHDPYNIQVSAGDDTFTANDLTSSLEIIPCLSNTQQQLP